MGPVAGKPERGFGDGGFEDAADQNNTTVFVGGLDELATADDLRQHFSALGEISCVWLSLSLVPLWLLSFLSSPLRLSSCPSRRDSRAFAFLSLFSPLLLSVSRLARHRAKQRTPRPPRRRTTDGVCASSASRARSPGRYLRVPPGKGCGFVGFVERAAAEMAITTMQGSQVRGYRVGGRHHD
jgi:RNA recognition motif-containing protein